MFCVQSELVRLNSFNLLVQYVRMWQPLTSYNVCSLLSRTSWMRNIYRGGIDGSTMKFHIYVVVYSEWSLYNVAKQVKFSKPLCVFNTIYLLNNVYPRVFRGSSWSFGHAIFDYFIKVLYSDIVTEETPTRAVIPCDCVSHLKPRVGEETDNVAHTCRLSAHSRCTVYSWGLRVICAANGFFS